MRLPAAVPLQVSISGLWYLTPATAAAMKLDRKGAIQVGGALVAAVLCSSMLALAVWLLLIILKAIFGFLAWSISWW